MKLWEYNKITGYWKYVKTVPASEAQEWLAIFREDNPSGIYMLSSRKPNKYPC